MGLSNWNIESWAGLKVNLLVHGLRFHYLAETAMPAGSSPNSTSTRPLNGLLQNKRDQSLIVRAIFGKQHSAIEPCSSNRRFYSQLGGNHCLGQVIKLPDWAVIDLRTKPDALWPGKVVGADFFDEHWKLRPLRKETFIE